jgi:putative FmdB family regulatory protein
MPLHDYLCRACGATSEILVRGDSTEAHRCKSCGGTDLARLLSAHNVGGSTRREPPAGGCCGDPGSCGTPGRCCGG